MLASIKTTLARFASYDTRILEVLHAALLTAWSVLLLLPHPLFDTAAMHERMSQTASELHWGGGALVVLFIIVIGLLRDSPEWRRLGSMLGVLWWGTVAANGILSAPYASGPWVYLIFTNFLGWAYIKGRG